jgi:hypothetical protein
MSTRAAAIKVPRRASGIRFRRITGCQQDIETLYELLQARESGISHVSMPTRSNHRKFVLNHPYRFWYLIEREGVVLGSLYFHFDNSVGISMPRQTSALKRGTLEEALAMHRPLRGVKSVRSGGFFVNASPQDRTLQRALKDLGWVRLQTTYAANSKTWLGGKHV